MLGVGAKKKTYLDDLFSTYLWKGNATARSINNGIDLSGEGGLTWIKSRSVGKGHILNDTARGAGNRLTIDQSASASGSAFLSSFNSNGFSIGTDGDVNENNETFSSWSFRKSKGFFTCLTFTGSGSNRTISHDLGCVPGFYIVKKYNDTGDWICYHKDLGPTKHLDLNNTNAVGTESTYWNDTAPTASVFSIGSSDEVNKNGDSFVCYLFAHNNGDGTFGESGDKDIIKCGSYSGSSSSVIDINLGWEPQWVLIKKSSGTSNWFIGDSMRGMVTGGQDARFWADTTAAETTNEDHIDFTSTGFKAKNNDDSTNDNGTHVYIAIRRSDGYVGKPQLATDVFAMDAGNSSSTIPCFDSGFPVDFAFLKLIGGTENWYTHARLIKGKALFTDTTDAEGLTLLF